MNKVPTIDLKALAQKIQLTRKVRGLTQVEMANRLDCNYRHYQDIEAGKVNMRVDLLMAIVNVLSVSPCFLFETKKDNINPPQHAFWCNDLLESMTVPIRLVDPNGLITFANSHYCKLLGCDRSEVEGHCYIWDFLADENEKEKLKEHIKYLGRELPEPTIVRELLRSKSGEQISVIVKWDYVFDTEGKLKGFVAVVDPNDERRYVKDSGN